MTLEIRVRPARSEDLGAIRDIYNHYVLTSTCTFQTEPLGEEEHREWFGGHGDAHPVIVADLAETVVAWAALSPWKPRGAYARTTEASVYVHHDQHRRGIGRTLMLDLIERARAVGHHAILGGTCAEQTASLALQANLGFREVGRFLQVGHKFGRWLDVVYMQLLL